MSSQIESFLYAFALIGAMMCFIFGSFKTGLLSMVPNVWPILLTLGGMGWLGIPLDYNKIMIATVAMGIAVDDTIHFVSRYHHEFNVSGSYAEALTAAMTDVGHAVFVTSLVLVLGFLVNLFSVLDASAQSGVLLATTIATALVADLLLTPALVLTIEPFGPEGAPPRRAPGGRVRRVAPPRRCSRAGALGALWLVRAAVGSGEPPAASRPRVPTRRRAPRVGDRPDLAAQRAVRRRHRTGARDDRRVRASP